MTSSRFENGKEHKRPCYEETTRILNEANPDRFQRTVASIKVRVRHLKKIYYEPLRYLKKLEGFEGWKWDEEEYKAIQEDWGKWAEAFDFFPATQRFRYAGWRLFPLAEELWGNEEFTCNYLDEWGWDDHESRPTQRDPMKWKLMSEVRPDMKLFRHKSWNRGSCANSHSRDHLGEPTRGDGGGGSDNPVNSSASSSVASAQSPSEEVALEPPDQRVQLPAIQSLLQPDNNDGAVDQIPQRPTVESPVSDSPFRWSGPRNPEANPFLTRHPKRSRFFSEREEARENDPAYREEFTSGHRHARILRPNSQATHVARGISQAQRDRRDGSVYGRANMQRGRPNE